MGINGDSGVEYRPENRGARLENRFDKPRNRRSFYCGEFDLLLSAVYVARKNFGVGGSVTVRPKAKHIVNR